MVPVDCLPPIGFVAEKSGKKLCAIWMYLSGTAVASIEWLVANPDAGPKAKVASIKALVTQCRTIAATCGVRRIWTTTNNEGLIRLYERCGFQVTDRGVTHMIAGVE